MKPLARMMVNCGRGRFTYEVVVWRTLKQLRKNLDRKEGTLAFHRGFSVYLCRRNRVKQKPLIGQLHFALSSLRMGIITHECGHAALHWCHVTGRNPMVRDDTCSATKAEEDFCWVLGNLARQVVLKTQHLMYDE